MHTCGLSMLPHSLAKVCLAYVSFQTGLMSKVAPISFVIISVLHAGLAHYVPQSNNFVVFSAYFHTAGQQGLAASPWVSHPCLVPALPSVCSTHAPFPALSGWLRPATPAWVSQTESTTNRRLTAPLLMGFLVASQRTVTKPDLMDLKSVSSCLETLAHIHTGLLLMDVADADKCFPAAAYSQKETAAKPSAPDQWPTPEG